MSQRLFWNYLPISYKQNDSWWTITSDLEYYRIRFTFYTSSVRLLIVATVVVIAVAIDVNVNDYTFAMSNEILSIKIQIFSWFWVETYWVIVLQCVSGFLAFYFSYMASTTRMQRFCEAVPCWLVQVLAITSMLVYCRSEDHATTDKYCKNHLSSNFGLGQINETDSDSDGEEEQTLPWLNDSRFLAIGITWIFLTIYVSVIATSHAWNEHKPLMRASHLYSYDIFTSATGFMESLILRNLKLQTRIPLDGISVGFEPKKGGENKVKYHRDSIYNLEEQKEMTRKNNEKAFAKYKRPFIFACPTLYHETDYEMKQLFVSICRLNKNQIQSQIKDLSRVDSNTDAKNYQPYDIEFNVFFDKPFVRRDDDPTNLPINEYVKQLHKIMLEGSKSVRFTEEIFCVSQDDGQEHIPEIKLPTVTETPYGIQLEYKLPLPDSVSLTNLKANIFRVHLKDSKKIQSGKRFSQCLYLYWLLGFRNNKSQLGIPEELQNRSSISDPNDRKSAKSPQSSQSQSQAQDTDDHEYFILALDGDVDFQPKALTTLLNRMARSPKNGAACGRIYPLGSGPVYWFQVWEYAIGHWLQKATEDVLGSVLCSPGCFSLVRADALINNVNSEPNSLITKYVRRPTGALDWIQWNMGEDRWMCTLLLERGWRIEYVALSDAFTYAPTDFGEFFKQRRRWGPSTVFNIYDLISNTNRTRGLNDSISLFYIIYQAVLQVSSFLALATVTMIIQGSFEFVFKWDSLVSLVLALIPVLFFIVICFFTKDETQLFWVNILTIMYFVIMLVVFIAIIVSMFQPGALCNLSNQFTLGIYAVYVITGLLHIKEAHPLKETLYTLIIYSLLTPTAFILLNIYQFINLNVTSWGTRESKSSQAKAGKSAKSSAADQYLGREFSSRTTNCGHLFYCHCCPDDDDFREYNERVEKKKKIKFADDKGQGQEQQTLHQQPRKNIADTANLAGTVNHAVNKMKKGILKKSQSKVSINSCPEFSRHKSFKSSNTLNDLDKDEDDDVHVESKEDVVEALDIKYELYDLKEIEKMNKDDSLKHKKLTHREYKFFHWLTSDLLKPKVETDDEKKELTEKLLELRNSICLGFFLFNGAWLVITYTVSQAFINSDTQLRADALKN